MARSRSDRLTRASVEQVLDGHPGVLAPPALGALLAAGRAPAHGAELTGEESAVAAYRAARVAGLREAGPSAPAVPLRRSVTRLLAMKAAAATVVVAGGGLAVAAATGTLPPVPFLPPAPPSHGVGPAHPGQASTGVPSSPGATIPPDGPGGPGGPGGLTGAATATPGAKAAASLLGLCRAYLAMPAGQARRALETPPFAALVAAADGAERVPAYCATLVSAAPTAPASPAPSPKPSGSSARPGDPAGVKTPKPSKTPKTKTTERMSDPASRPPSPLGARGA
jgi:hypothetical protein